ncbi:immunoglobulin superfamily member 6-like isoform X1 [Hemitrygon akajei]|uniref:immunoglobulin superfamily member 6-like isoform X1 n=1 Tax=Hemitrygon akajei TaxID=2704970 RepID=UPI003BF995CA
MQMTSTWGGQSQVQQNVSVRDLQRDAGVAAEVCTVTVNQAPHIVHQLDNNLTISCNFTTRHCSGSPVVTWFSIHGSKSTSQCLDHCKFEEENDKSHSDSSTQSWVANLNISRVSWEDSGIYYCGVAYPNIPGQPRLMGNGTTLRIGGQKRSILWLQLLMVSILSLYAICITVYLVQTLQSLKSVDLLRRNPSEVPGKAHTSRAVKALTNELNYKFRKGSNDPSSQPQLQSHSAAPDDSIYQNM